MSWKKEASHTPGAGLAQHLPAVFLWNGNSCPPGRGCLEITWYLVGPSHRHECGFVSNQVNSPKCFKTSSILSFKMLERAVPRPWGKSSHLAGAVSVGAAVIERRGQLAASGIPSHT